MHSMHSPPVIYHSIHTQALQMLNSGQVVLIIRPSEDDLREKLSKNHAQIPSLDYCKSVSPVCVRLPDHTS